MKTRQQLQDAIEGRIKAINDHIDYLNSKIEKDFVMGFDGGYVSDKYQSIMESNFLSEAVGVLQISKEDSATHNLHRYKEILISNLVKGRPTNRHNDALKTEAMKEAIIYIEDLLKY